MSIAEKIKKVMDKVEYLQKDGEVSYGRTKYAYLSEEKITTSMNKAFREVGLIIYPSNMEVVQNTGNMAQIIATYTVQDTESDDYIEVQTIGEGQDKGDKKMNKAMTAAFKYAQRQAFMIPTGDDPDHTSTAELEDDVTTKEIRKNELQKLSKKYNKDDVIESYKTNMKKSKYSKIDELDELEWENILVQITEEVE